VPQTDSLLLKMFRTALGGGLLWGDIISIKVPLSKPTTFLDATISMNFIGFIAIYLYYFGIENNLAMTASALIKALEELF
jgi:site-specific recombinase